jgi:aldehyde dehydrogenase (NAD+)
VSFGQMLAPALAAANTIVLKPPELAPFSCLRLGQIATEVGFPAGVVNVVPGGPVGGDALVSHPGVDKIFFTGSGATAKKIQASAAARLTPACFELGGKSARLVFADADLDQAAMHAVGAAIGLAGQACIAGTRVLVEDSVYDDVLARMKAIAESVPIGDPRDVSTVMGPVISEGAVNRIMGFVDRACASGSGRLVTGGRRLTGDLADGYFIAPTIFADMDNTEEVTREEIFGPVVSVLRFSTEDEAVGIANDTEYGLAAYIETTNLQRAHRVSAALDSGTVWINGFVDLPVGAPFGGVKQSGNGRVGGIYGIQEFTRAKNVWMSL